MDNYSNLYTHPLIEGIKILATGPLYYTVFVSAGLDCFGTKKKIGTIGLTQSEEDPICTDNETDEDTGGVGNQAFKLRKNKGVCILLFS